MRDKAFRIAQDQKVIKKRLKLVKAADMGYVFEDGKTHYEQQLEKANKFSKQHPMDCGKKDCVMCHTNKVKPKGNLKKKQKEIKQNIEDE